MDIWSVKFVRDADMADVKVCVSMTLPAKDYADAIEKGREYLPLQYVGFNVAAVENWGPEEDD